MVDLSAKYFIDWDFLSSPITITKIGNQVDLPNKLKKIVIERDEDYNLKGTLNFDDLKFVPQRNDIAGTFDEGFDIKGLSDDDSISYLLESCHIGGIRFSGETEFVGTGDLGINGFRMQCSENTPSHLTEWYVNGPTTHVFGSTQENQEKVFQYCTREHFLLNRKLTSAAKMPLADGFTTQLIWGKHKDCKFLIHKIPLGPKWSTNVGIEYREDWGGIPPHDERVKIEELCSFVFGKHLLSVGHTIYDKDENIVEAYANSPWGNNAKHLCLNPEYPPIRINSFPFGGAEKIINNLLPRYMELSDHIRLKEALWNYWISCDIPPGLNLPIVASALETIISNWYKWKKLPNRGLYMKTAEFKKLLQNNIDDIKKKLEMVKSGEKILNNIQNANQFYISLQQKYKVFFDETKLNVSQVQWDAFAGRHQFVHGLACFDKTDWKQAIRQKNIIDTLFNKAVLKILDYKGDYIDRSVEGWPDSQLG